MVANIHTTSVVTDQQLGIKIVFINLSGGLGYYVPAKAIVGIDGTHADVTASNNLKVTLGTLLAGEDLTNDVIKVEERFSHSAVATADVQVKGSAGFLHAVTISCNDAAPTAGSFIIYDSLTETGTVVFSHTFTTTPFVPFTVILDCVMATGIYLGFTTTGDVNVVCSYR